MQWHLRRGIPSPPIALEVLMKQGFERCQTLRFKLSRGSCQEGGITIVITKTDCKHRVKTIEEISFVNI